MGRKATAAIVGVAIVLVSVFLVPVAQVSFASPRSQACTSGDQITSLCSSILAKGYGSISYWLFGAGGLYTTLPYSGYSVVL
ncbi:MAG TPA: hypothetical protein VGR56_04480 [Nitrososphaerales archaeon]|nr:hypothetical protein [Nitrososphaerales archaeon]